MLGHESDNWPKSSNSLPRFDSVPPSIPTFRDEDFVSRISSNDWIHPLLSQFFAQRNSLIELLAHFQRVSRHSRSIFHQTKPDEQVGSPAVLRKSIYRQLDALPWRETIYVAIVHENLSSF